MSNEANSRAKLTFRVIRLPIIVAVIYFSLQLYGYLVATGWLPRFASWARDDGNAGLVQVLTAIAQATFAALLLCLTFFSTMQVRDQAARAVRPVIVFRRVRFFNPQGGMPFSDLVAEVTNAGLGPALNVTFTCHPDPAPYLLDQEGQLFTIRENAEELLELHLQNAIRFLLANDRKDGRGWVSIVRIAATYSDLYGNGFETEVGVWVDQTSGKSVLRLKLVANRT